jgi:hypothetical protein
MTYEPSVIVIAQGRKRVELGRNVFLYDSSRFLLTSVDLPVVSRVIEATESVPCLAMSLKVEMSVVRELLTGEEIRVPEARGSGRTMPSRFAWKIWLKSLAWARPRSITISACSPP